MKIFEKIKVGNMEFKNRMAMAPMTRNRADEKGIIVPEAAEYYTQRAGAGLIITEATAICADGYAYIHTPGVFSEEQVRAWKNVTDAVHKKGGKIFIQLWHPGRVSHSSLIGGEIPVAPSVTETPIKTVTAEGLVDATPAREATLEDIKRIVKCFGDASRKAIEAGFDGVQIHGANGYLIDQFLKSGSNLRTDEYGTQNNENRTRFLFEVIDEVTAAIGPERTAVRFTPYNSFNEVYDPNPKPVYEYIMEKLNSYNLSFVEINESQYNVEKYDPEKKAVFDTWILRNIYKGMLMVNSGYNLEKAETVLKEGKADMVSFGTLYLANPDLDVRFKEGYPLNEPDQSTFYTWGTHGYTDYPFYK